MEQLSDAGEYSGGASGSAARENVEESPALPFPQRFPEFSQNYPPTEHFVAMNNGVPLTNNEGTSGVGDDNKSCLFISAVFSLFVAMAMVFGLYGADTLRLGPNTSMLIKPNSMFVESIKAVELDGAKGSMLYGFDKDPPLDVKVTWSEAHKIPLPTGTHKEWIYYLNEGSQMDISYGVDSLSSSYIVLVIVKDDELQPPVTRDKQYDGQEGLAKWLRDPLYPDTTLSWNIIHGNGSIQKHVSESSVYYIAVGNVNSNVVEVHLNTRIKGVVHNATAAHYKCTPSEGQCTFRLPLIGENAAVLTSPGLMPDMSVGEYYVKLSYGPRLVSYLVGAGVMTFLLVFINNYFNRNQDTLQDTIRDQLGENRSERNPLLSCRDDNISNHDSSNVSILEGEEYVEDTQGTKLCAICFDARKDCFFLPCGHNVACFECATRILNTSAACPICRGPTKEVRKIYAV